MSEAQLAGRWRDMARNATAEIRTRVAQFHDMAAISKQALRIAKDMTARARTEEPAATLLLEFLARSNHGRMSGLKFRSVLKCACRAGSEWLSHVLIVRRTHSIKTVSSLRRKLVARFAERVVLVADQGGDPASVSLEAIAADTQNPLCDILRYTMLLPVESYTQGVRTVRASLRERGFAPRTMDNFWPLEGDTREVVSYLGINSLVATPSGYVFELQFHTPESVDVKQVHC